jgi:hypothetical protein
MTYRIPLLLRSREVGITRMTAETSKTPRRSSRSAGKAVLIHLRAFPQHAPQR